MTNFVRRKGGIDMASWIVGGAVALLVGAIVWKMVKDNRSGKGHCGCDCASCRGCGQGK